jgi:DNA helicase HerA-like ATPase
LVLLYLFIFYFLFCSISIFFKGNFRINHFSQKFYLHQPQNEDGEQLKELITFSATNENYGKHNAFTSIHSYIEVFNFDSVNKVKAQQDSFINAWLGVLQSKELLTKYQLSLIKVAIPKPSTNIKGISLENEQVTLFQRIFFKLTYKMAYSIDNFNSIKDENLRNEVNLHVQQFVNDIYAINKSLNEIRKSEIANPGLIALINFFMFNKTNDFHFDSMNNFKKVSPKLEYLQSLTFIDNFFQEFLKKPSAIFIKKPSDQNNFQYSGSLQKYIPNINELFEKSFRDEWFENVSNLEDLSNTRSQKPIKIKGFFDCLKNSLKVSSQLNELSLLKQMASNVNSYLGEKPSMEKIRSKYIKRSFNLKIENNDQNLLEQSFSIYKIRELPYQLDFGWFSTVVNGSDEDTIIFNFQDFEKQTMAKKRDLKNSIIRYELGFSNKLTQLFQQQDKRASAIKNKVDEAFSSIFLKENQMLSFSGFIIRKFDNGHLASLPNYLSAEKYKDNKYDDYSVTTFSEEVNIKRCNHEQSQYLNEILFPRLESIKAKENKGLFEPFESHWFISNYEQIAAIGMFTTDNEFDNNRNSSIFFGENYQSKTKQKIMIDMARYRDGANINVPSSNGHMVVIGKSGSGKTYFAKSLAFQKSQFMKVFIFDIENEYNDIFSIISLQNQGKLVSGTISLSDENKTINPFKIIISEDEEKQIYYSNKFNDFLSEKKARDVFPNLSGLNQVTFQSVYNRHKVFLLRFLKILFDISNFDFDLEIYRLIDLTYEVNKESNDKDYKNIIHQERYTLNDFLKRINDQAKILKFDDFSDFKEGTGNLSAKTITSHNSLAHFYYQMMYKIRALKQDASTFKRFQKKTSQELENLDKDFYRFDLSGLLTLNGIDKSNQLAFMTMLNFLNIKIFMKEISNTQNQSSIRKREGIFVLIDETHRYLKKDLVDMVDFMAALAKQGRKRFAEMCIVSQNISDFYRSSDSQDIVQKALDVVKNCGYKFIMQLAQDHDRISEFISSGFPLTEKDSTFVRSLTKGTGYLVQGPLERLEVKVSRPISYEKYEKIYRIFLKNGLLKLMQLKAENENMNTSGFDSKSLQEEMNKIKSDLNSKVENFKDKHMIDKQKYPEDKLLADLLSAIVKDILKSI